MRRSVRLCSLCTFVVVVAVVLFSLGTVAAAARSVVVDSGEIRLESGADGSYVAKVTLLNLGDSPVYLRATAQGDAGSQVTVAPSTLEPGRRTEVTLTLGSGTDVDDGVDIALQYNDGTSTTTDTLNAVLAPPSPGVDWGLLFKTFGVGFLVSLFVVVSTTFRMRLWKKPFGFTKTMPYLGTDWSFKDSWVSNVTLGAGVLVGLIGSSSALESIVGSTPGNNVLGFLAVAGTGSAILVTLGPLFLKVIGSETEVPTVGGTLVASFVVLGGTLAQISALAWQGAAITLGSIRKGIIAVGVVVGLVVVWYGTTELRRIVRRGVKHPGDTKSGEEKAIWDIAKAIREQVATSKGGELKTADGEEAKEPASYAFQPRRRSALM